MKTPTDYGCKIKIQVTKLKSGYYHIRGNGPCNWAQPPFFPCSEGLLREHTFEEASESFIQDVLKYMEEWGK